MRALHHEPELTLGGDPVKVVKETRFLGMIFDSKLSFIPHIKALKARCLKALDIIKVVSSKDWGADCNVLLQLYRSLVRSKLDYDRFLMNVQPVVPISISKDWNLISRTIVPVVTQDELAVGVGRQTGLGDTTESLWFSPVKPVRRRALSVR